MKLTKTVTYHHTRFEVYQFIKRKSTYKVTTFQKRRYMLQER